MLKNQVTRLAVIAGSAAALVLGTAGASSAADSYLYLEIDNNLYGTMRHIDNGDDFRVCDTRVDGHGVTGEVQYYSSNFGWVSMDSQSDGGDTGCDTFHENVKEGVQYRMKLCWNVTSDVCAYKKLQE